MARMEHGWMQFVDADNTTSITIRWDQIRSMYVVPGAKDRAAFPGQAHASKARPTATIIVTPDRLFRVTETPEDIARRMIQLAKDLNQL